MAVLMVSYASSMRAYLEQRAHLSDLRASIDESRGNIEQLKREKRRWDDPAFVELQARQRFGWVLPGEIGFQVIDEAGQPLTEGDSLTDPDAAPDVDRPEWWETAWESVEVAGKPEKVSQRPPADRIEPPGKPRKLIR
jgi:hypothetical protein